MRLRMRARWTHAGDVLHLSQSAVSRQIRALEETLGTTLFHRHARQRTGSRPSRANCCLTPHRPSPRSWTPPPARIRDSEEEVFGELKVTTTTGFGTLWLAPRLTKLTNATRT